MTLLNLPRRGACGLVLLVACNVSSGDADPSTTSNQDREDERGVQPGDDLNTSANPNSDGPARSASAACPPPGLFTEALCLCEDFKDVGLLTVRGGSGGEGSVGVNGTTHFVNATDIEGSLNAHRSFSAVAAAQIGSELRTTGDASWVGRLGVGGDLSVGGDARGIGLLELDGALRVAGRASLLGASQVAARGDYQAPAAPPCPCDPSTFFDVEGAVEAARTTNDNDANGVSAQLRQVGLSSLSLSSGSYYFADPKTVGALILTISGQVSMYVDGHLDSVGLEHIHLEPDAELDLYVSGGLRSVGLTALGSAEASSRLRIYVGGQDPVLLSVGAQTFYGAIYAPQAELTYVGATRVVGSLFARTLRGVGLLAIEQGDTGPVDPGRCDPPDSDDASVPEGPADAGVPTSAPDAGDDDAPDGDPVDVAKAL